MITRLAPIFLCLCAAVLHAGEKEKPPAFTRVKPGATLQSPAVTEASGLAASPTAADALWLINDSGSPAVLHLAGTDGSDRGSVALRDIRNTDWEDLASFTLGGKSYLLVADTGDNTSTRPECLLHIVAEPAPPAAGKKLDDTVSPAWTIRFRYEDGPRDCESVAVDEKAGKILLISKRTTPPVIYELPLKPDGKDLVTAKKIGTIATPFPVGNPPIPFAAQPTGFDDPVLREWRIGLQALGAEGANTPPASALARRGIVQGVVGFPMWGVAEDDSPPAHLIEAVAQGRIDTAIVWGPFAGYFARDHGEALTLRPVLADPLQPGLAFRYDLAVGVRRGDDELLRLLQAALDRRETEVRQLLQAHGVPLLPSAPSTLAAASATAPSSAPQPVRP